MPSEKLRFLVDENISRTASRALIDAGYDVLVLKTADPGLDDEAIISKSASEGRIFIIIVIADHVNEFAGAVERACKLKKNFRDRFFSKLKNVYLIKKHFLESHLRDTNDNQITCKDQ